MHTITVHIAERPDTITLGYKSVENAKAAYGKLKAINMLTIIELDDDFGQSVSLQPKSIAGVALRDVQAQTEMNSDLMFLNAHAQAKYMKRVQADGELMNAARQAQGAGVAMPQRGLITVGPGGPMNG